MVLYELVIALKNNTCKKGLIWCTDGSFISSSEFKNSGKVAYGYALSNNKVVSIRKSEFTYKWSGGNSPFYSPFYQRIASSESLTDGVRNSNALRNVNGYSSTNCPAIYQCLNMSNANKQSYMPAGDELEDLYKSIMYGKMKDDLIIAGVYEECNYREAVSSRLSSLSWGWIWSSSQCLTDSYYNIARSVDYLGAMLCSTKTHYYYVIPFFKF